MIILGRANPLRRPGKKMKNGFSMFQYVSVHAKDCRFPPSGDLLGYVPTDASFQCMSGLKGKRMVQETVKPYFIVKKSTKKRFGRGVWLN